MSDQPRHKSADDFGNPPFPQLRYCLRCCMPETNEGMAFDELGICKACRSSEQKMHIDWEERQHKLRKLLDQYRARDNGYDCIVPISGGKDSAFQLHVLTRIYGMKPLAVTFSHNWYTETGRYNLQNILDRTNVDHIMFSPNRDLVNRLARQSAFKIGDACWHCHMGIEAFPLQVAVKWRIPLLIFGESPAEHSGRATYLDNPEFAHDFFLQHSAKVRPDQMVCDSISSRDVFPFQPPSLQELEGIGVRRIFLGDYMFWDAERQTEFVIKEYAWKEDDVEGTYKRYKSVECRMPGVHDYAKFLKRGFGRGTDFANQDVRAGLLTREEGFELARRYDSQRPAALDYYLQITGLTEAEFEMAIKNLRPEKAKDLP
jgi:N-acetyl sugar amidotransferase